MCQPVVCPTWRPLPRDDRLALYVDLEPDDDRVADALDEIDIDPVDLPEGFEERICTVVREEVEH
ncbi:hypothetical protein [Halocatena marina]|uniref:Uncharacterized protein n=1 Tax=Halocatena marina TaxID=2934937 RepID=A0ABD5YVF7_9EURY|nr:hypothetical protein [Halocatena marina]